jgi:Uma2 family endonuclease
MPDLGALTVSTITTKQTPPRGMTVDEFEQLEESLGDARIELIDGRVFGRGEMNPRHVRAMDLTRRTIEPMLPVDRFFREDKPVLIPDFNEPFPDLAVVRGDSSVYTSHHPGPEDVSLLIEVSDTTLVKDRGVKKDNYGRAQIPVYWIVNLVDRQVEVHSDPRPDGYASREEFRSGDYVPVVLDGKVAGQIAVDDILP